MVSKPMQWYQTKWWERSFASIDRETDRSFAWYEFNGRREADWSDADLWTTKPLANVLAHYGMGPDQIPDQGYRFKSAASANFIGTVLAKVLRPKKFIFITTQKPSIEIGVELIHKLWNGPVEETRRQYISFLELRDRTYKRKIEGPGQVIFPRIEFDIHRRYPVHVHLHVKLQYFIEGDAVLDMGNLRLYLDDFSNPELESV